jgi:Holliday junction resolvase-like predicted endonuclease
MKARKKVKKKKNAWIIQTASTFIATKFRSTSSWTKIIKDCSKSTACSKTPQQHP